MRRTALLAAAVALAASSLTALTSSAPAQAATAKRPVIFVHGWQGSTGQFDSMVNKFKAAGYTDATLIRFGYDSNQSNATTAQQLASRIDQVRAATGWGKVDLVSHSMGGLSTRYYLKNLGGTAKVDDWVSLGGPNHGTNTANLCSSTACQQMRIGSSFLNQLNYGDETPGDSVYSTYWSNCDAVINPDDSVLLSGASNNYVGCLGHNQMLSVSWVEDAVRSRVND